MTTEEVLAEYERVRRTGWAPEPMLTDEMRDEIIRLAGLLKSEQELGEALNNESNQRGERIEKLERSVRLLSGLDDEDGA